MKKKIDKNMHYRNITLSTRVSAAQKAEYVKIASSHNISVSEWMASVIEMNKFSYGKNWRSNSIRNQTKKRK